MMFMTDSALVNTDSQPVPAQLRLWAARAASVVIDGGRSSNDAISGVLLTNSASGRDQALVKEMALGVIRWYWTLEEILQRLLKTRIRNKDRDIFFLLMIGVYQLKFMRIPAHAAVDATVQACEPAGKPWAKSLVNGVLRNYARHSADIDRQLTSDAARFSHPDWIRARVVTAWPQAWKKILDANNAHPPMCLRVNLGRIERNEYLGQLQKAGIGAGIDPHAATGLIVDKPVAVESLPGFYQGWASVQDTAAQLVVPALDLQPGHRVLDACAAPGSKTAHMLESEPELSEVIAVDIDRERVKRLRQTLERLQLTAQCIVADVAQVDTWWDGVPFDRVLIDAPCSGSGVIRRHPDIKHNRQPADVDALCKIQARLLQSLWPLVASGGRLMYVTCSVFPEENQNQICAFLDRHPETIVESLPIQVGIDCAVGRQTLPGVHDMDGFFFSMLRRGND
jgi:16S rRNA (cytosine967-C5)-methyltransferase